MDVAVRTEGLSRDFGNLRAVDGLSLEVPKGIVFGFLGPNGSGKTTTIRLLLGLLAPSAGRAVVLGHDVCSEADVVRSKTGALLEHDGLYERLSAYDNLDLYGRIYGLGASQRASRNEELLRHIGLWDRRREPVGDWSRGMRQKLAVARALLHRPPLVFLDEPSAGLDPVAAVALREDLVTLTASEGTTVFLTTHNLAEAEKLCALVGVVNRGRLLAVGHPDDLRGSGGGSAIQVLGTGFTDDVLAALRAHQGIRTVHVQDGRLRVEAEPDVDSAAITRLLVTAGADVREVRRERASLEDVFITLVEEEKE